MGFVPASFISRTIIVWTYLFTLFWQRTSLHEQRQLNMHRGADIEEVWDYYIFPNHMMEINSCELVHRHASYGLSRQATQNRSRVDDELVWCGSLTSAVVRSRIHTHLSIGVACMEREQLAAGHACCLDRLHCSVASQTSHPV
jgi:hypothetical protein